MNYLDFKNKILNYPIIFSKDITALETKKQTIRNQLKRWQDKKLILNLKRGVYILNENDRRLNPSRQFVANQLYSPSYVSLEYALSFYGFIPERVSDVTSISTKKTTRFVNSLGTFTYQHILVSAFRGFKSLTDQSGLTYFIADPEKAMIDFLYLNLDRITLDKKDIFSVSFRFQNVEDLSPKLITEYARLFNNNKLNKTAKMFLDFIKGEAK